MFPIVRGTLIPIALVLLSILFLHQPISRWFNNNSVASYQQMRTRHTQGYEPSQSTTQVSKPRPIKDYNLVVKKKFKDNLRQWTTVSESFSKQKGTSSRKGVEFSLMCYNVLSQELLEKHPHLYRHHNRQHLNWDFRWANLQAEILHHKSDIICLQEVQSSHYKTHFTTFLKKMGYKGVFKKRTGMDYPDGCAIFYNTKKFRNIEAERVEYFQPDIPLLNRNNVGIVARFEPHGHLNKSFVVATTHLLYNPKREDVRIAQMQLLLTEIDRLAYNQQEKKMVPVILCGDFNSGAKKDSNGVYQLIIEKHVEYTKFTNFDKSWLPPNIGITNTCKHLNLAIKRIENSVLTRKEEEELILLNNSERKKQSSSSLPEIKEDLFTSGLIMHDFNFVPVYLQDAGVSTNHDEWITVDYLFYSRATEDDSGLKLLKRYDLPTTAKLQEKNITTIPNSNLGSDHFSLVATFQLEV